MTANQIKRIRARLEKSAQLSREAIELFREFNPNPYTVSVDDYGLRDIVVRAADSGSRTLRDLEHYDEDQRMEARRVIRDSAPLIVGDLVASTPTVTHPQVVGTIAAITPLDNAIIDQRRTTIDGKVHEVSGQTMRPLSLLFRIYE